MANSNRSNNAGNFANDREKASEAGHKGGMSSSGNSRTDSHHSRDAGSKSFGNFANDAQRAAEAGRKGGEQSHGGNRNRSDNY